MTHSGPRVVSPPTSATSCARASSPSPAANCASQPGSACGSVSASSAQAGRAPMAARSLRLTASARCPREPGRPARGSARPRPACRSPPPAPSGRRRQQRRVVADAEAHVAARRAAAAEVAVDECEFSERHVRPAASVLVGPQLARGAIQHGVHELVAVGGAEALRERHRLVDDDAVRHIGARAELEQRR